MASIKSGAEQPPQHAAVFACRQVWVKHGFQPKLVCCSAGDLVLWDSRTVHCNSPALEPDAQQQAVPDFIRAVAYVCMTPR